jgi:CRISPR-associated protein Csb2
LGLESCGLVAQAIRRELARRHGPTPPEWIIGHAHDGTTSKLARPANLPLGFVGQEYADGHLLGTAIVIPRDFEFTEELFQLLSEHNGAGDPGFEPATPYLSLTLKNQALQNREVGHLYLKLDERPERQRPFALQSSRWTKPARVWKSITPLILPMFPSAGSRAEEIVATACADSGYPQPVAVHVSFSPLVRGVPHSRAFELRPGHRRPPRPLNHAEIEFASLVQGPVLIGPGRHAGYGAFLPSAEENNP